MAVADYLARCVIIVIGMVYPGYQSFKAIKKEDKEKQSDMLKYWLVLSVVAAVSLVVEPILYSRIPMWPLVKIALVAFLSLPTTAGYKKIYDMVLEPQLAKHESAIDDAADKFVKAGQEQARNLGPQVNRLVQQGRDMATKTLNKKAS